MAEYDDKGRLIQPDTLTPRHPSEGPEMHIIHGPGAGEQTRPKTVSDAEIARCEALAAERAPQIAADREAREKAEAEEREHHLATATAIKAARARCMTAGRDAWLSGGGEPSSYTYKSGALYQRALEEATVQAMIDAMKSS